MPDYSHAKKIIEAAERGETVQFQSCGWHCENDRLGRYLLETLNNPSEFRIKLQPKLVPYTYETFPRSAAKIEFGRELATISYIDCQGVHDNSGVWRFDALVSPTCDAKLLDYAGNELPKGITE